MPVTPELVERYHQTARDVAARAVLLPDGFRFSTSTERPDWTEEALQPLRNFHARFAGPNGEPPLAAHLAATLKHRERLSRGGPADIAAVAVEERLNATYLAALWAGLNDKSGESEDVTARTKMWAEQAAQIAAEKLRRQKAMDAATATIESRWRPSKLMLSEGKVPEAGSVPFESSVSIQPGELLLLTVLPNESHGADSTLIEWSIREVGGEQRIWSLADLVPRLLDSNPLPDSGNAHWSFLEETLLPKFLTDRRDSNGGRPELKSWSLGSEPSVFVNTGVEPVKVWTTLPARSFFVHPGPKRNVAIAWTSPTAGDLVVTGRVADAHPTGGDGVSFDLSQMAAGELGQALAVFGSGNTSSAGAGAAPRSSGARPGDMEIRHHGSCSSAVRDQGHARAVVSGQLPKECSTRSRQWLSCMGGYSSHRCSENASRAAAREPLFRMISLPAQSDTFVVWDRLRLEGGDGPPLVFAEHPELGAAIEHASGLKFGHHPQGRSVPTTALVTAAGAEIVIDLRMLPNELQTALTLPRFLCADVSLAEDSPENASVQAFLIAATGGGGNLAEPVAKATLGDPLAAQIMHPEWPRNGRGPLPAFGRCFHQQCSSSQSSREMLREACFFTAARTNPYGGYC
jgi:hypothetical protein